ncbi:MAG: 4Fe-4S dicluster domain-containing protein [Magnetococcus sp. WYHC-3]
MSQFARVIDTERCMGCRSCVAACAMENHGTLDSPWNAMMEWETGTYPHVGRNFVTMNCMHCEHPACKAACDAIGVKAISKNEFGVVLIDYSKCVGCKYCLAVCPYGVPQFNAKLSPLYPGQAATPYEAQPDQDRHPTHRKLANTVEKCTFCWHKMEKAVAKGEVHLVGKTPEYTPSCDLVCPVEARVFGDLDDPDSKPAQWLGRKKAAQLKKEFGTRPQVFYVLQGGDY